MNALIGVWILSMCTSVVIRDNKKMKDGFVLETFTFDKSANYQFQREWYKDPQCKNKTSVDKESGSFKIGPAITSSGIPGMFEIDFVQKTKTDKGVFVIEGDMLRVGRWTVGKSNERNTHLGALQYKKK